jgi:tetratricopeptide (TPR) repeat protein
MHKRRRAWLSFFLLSVGLVLAGFVAVRWYQTSRPDYRLERGRAAVREADFAAAEEMVRRLETAGHTDHAHLLQAAIHLELGRPNDAAGEIERIKSTDLLVEGALLHGEWLIRHGVGPAEAAKDFLFVLSKRPDNLVAHRGLATIHYDQGAWALAVVHLLRWAELDPSDGRHYRFIGRIYYEGDHFALAILAYRKALRANLAEATVQNVKEELAECLVKQSLYSEALPVLEECGPRADTVPALIALRADSLAGVGKTAEAEALLDKALQRHPHAIELLRVRGKLLTSAQKPAEAAKLLEQVLAHDPHDTTSRYQLTLAYELLDRRDEAAKHRTILEETKEGMVALTKLIQEAGEKPFDTALQKRLADMCERMGRPELAQRWLRAAAVSASVGSQKLEVRSQKSEATVPK